MLKFWLKQFSPFPFLLLLLLSHSFRALSQQIPFSLSSDLNEKKYFTLKQVLHHGGIISSGKTLFRKLEIEKDGNLVFEGDSLTGNGPSGEYVVNFLGEPRESGFGEEIIERRFPIPDHKDLYSILSLAKMSYNAYLGISGPYEWIDLEDVDYEKIPFGWEEVGLRGYIFTDPGNSTVIIAFKGTSLKYIYRDGETAPNDKYNASLLCNRIDLTWKGICNCKRDKLRCDGQCVLRESKRPDSYFESSLKIYNWVKSKFPNSTILLTGHSLGGSIASLVALKYNVPAIVFQTPGEMLYAKRIGLDVNNSSASNIYHFGHTADPIFTGDCIGVSTCYVWGFAMETKCHLGKSCPYDTRNRLGWSSNIKHHSLLTFIEKVIKEWSSITGGEEDVAQCQSETGCTDCTNWQFEY
ncbi:15576_t:CDS:2 [Acaulospora morrowiae]|uniref:triacylglycerol lipase n=1 Tax=Acaulospora morrowiae TaxID=94023 RepID=A0A9N9B3S1_9GLOM|nr:15576_t:CDS:2 [Acaulospora morrowiae]